MGKAVQPAPAGRRDPYERRRPEDTSVYRLVQEHLETFLARVEHETGAGLPKFVKDEFNAFSSAAYWRTAFCACVGARTQRQAASRGHSILRAPSRQHPMPGFPSMPENPNTPSADHAEASPPAALARLSWARFAHKTAGSGFERRTPAPQGESQGGLS
jgi:hypothetical protein